MQALRQKLMTPFESRTRGPEPLIQHVPLLDNASYPKHREPPYTTTAVDYSPWSDGRVTDDRTLPHLNPSKRMLIVGGAQVAKR